MPYRKCSCCRYGSRRLLPCYCYNPPEECYCQPFFRGRLFLQCYNDPNIFLTQRLQWLRITISTGFISFIDQRLSWTRIFTFIFSLDLLCTRTFRFMKFLCILIENIRLLLRIFCLCLWRCRRICLQGKSSVFTAHLTAFGRDYWTRTSDLIVPNDVR